MQNSPSQLLECCTSCARQAVGRHVVTMFASCWRDTARPSAAMQRAEHWAHQKVKKWNPKCKSWVTVHRLTSQIASSPVSSQACKVVLNVSLQVPDGKCCETLSWLVKGTAAVWSWNNASLGKGPMSILQASVAKGEQFHLRFNNSETADIHSTSFYIVLIESHCSHSCYLMRWLTYTRQYQDGQYRLYRTIRNCWAFRPGSHHLSRIEAAYNLASEKPALQANNVFHQRTFG